MDVTARDIMVALKEMSILRPDKYFTAADIAHWLCDSGAKHATPERIAATAQKIGPRIYSMASGQKYDIRTSPAKVRPMRQYFDRCKKSAGYRVGGVVVGEPAIKPAKVANPAMAVAMVQAEKERQAAEAKKVQVPPGEYVKSLTFEQLSDLIMEATIRQSALWQEKQTAVSETEEKLAMAKDLLK